MNILLIVKLLINITVFQQEDPISKVANIQAPEGSERIEKSAATAYVKSKFKLGSAFNEHDKNVKSIYKVDRVVVAFWDTLLSEQQLKLTTPPTLEEVKLMALRPFQWSGTNEAIDEANIVTINKNRFFILKFHHQDEYFYKFASEYKNGKSLCGSLQFKEEDKSKADQILLKTLKSISFKK